MNDKERKKWGRLYELGLTIKKISPWEYMRDQDLLVVHLSKRKASVWVSVMGNNEECYGIAAYPTIKGQTALNEFLSDEVGTVDPLSFPVATQEAAIAYFGDRDELRDEDYQLIKELGYRFRGSNNWLFFQSFAIGRGNGGLSLEEVETLIETYETIIPVLQQIAQGTIELDYSNRTYLTVVVDDAKNEVSYQQEPLPLPEKSMEHAPIFENELLLKRLSKLAEADMDIELSYFYVPVAVDESERPNLAVLILAVEVTSERMLFVDVINETDKINETIFENLVTLIQTEGRPNSITVRLTDLEKELFHFCEALDILLIHDSNCYVLDMMAASLPM